MFVVCWCVSTAVTAPSSGGLGHVCVGGQACGRNGYQVHILVMQYCQLRGGSLLCSLFASGQGGIVHVDSMLCWHVGLLNM